MEAATKALMEAAAATAFSAAPFCVASLGPGGADGRVVWANALFEEHFGPVFKFAHSPFVKCAEEGCDEAGRERLRQALEAAAGGARRAAARDVEVLTLAGEAGLPVRRRFDIWAGRAPGDDGTVAVFAEPVSEQTKEQREKDAELVDFFHNAPIALHWLSGEGIVLWANQTELDVLGYTAEEYIGQPIMKFCPDEEALVLQIFHQLGTGNAIKDVPVRFRAKSGKVVDLLIDSNVNYKRDGSFNHTRCFIRDDTGRKVREARQETLLNETRRSLRVMEAFIARTVHLVRTPCSTLRHTLDRLGEKLRGESQEAAELLVDSKSAMNHILALTADVADVVRFQQGCTMKTVEKPVELRRLGCTMMTLVAAKARKGVSCHFESDAGPDELVTDGEVLGRVLGHLLDNAAAATKEGSIHLHLGHGADGVTFSVKDTGCGFVPGRAAAATPFSVSEAKELAPADAEASRAAMSALTMTEDAGKGLGIGLSLSYSLVQALGGELRYESSPGATTFHFTLPHRDATPTEPHMSEYRFTATPTPDVEPLTEQYSDWDTVSRSSEVTAPSTQSGGEPAERRSLDDARPTLDGERVFVEEVESRKQVSPESLAGCGLKAMDPPHVLVVEDTVMCSKVLIKMLTRIGCTSDLAEDGAQAVAALKAAPEGTYDLILMDLRMPVMDGFDATIAIKNELGITTPVIAVTAEAGLTTNERCVEVGFEGVEKKPLGAARLKVLLSQHCGHVVEAAKAA